MKRGVLRPQGSEVENLSPTSFYGRVSCQPKTAWEAEPKAGSDQIYRAQFGSDQEGLRSFRLRTLRNWVTFLTSREPVCEFGVRRGAPDSLLS